jgi:hypothetical protein
MIVGILIANLAIFTNPRCERGRTGIDTGLAIRPATSSYKTMTSQVTDQVPSFSRFCSLGGSE